MARIAGTLHEDQYTFSIMSLSILLRTRNVSDKICREIRNTHYRLIFFFENCAFNGIMWENIVERGRPQMTIWHVHLVCWINKAKDAHSEYAILIAFPLQQWLHERSSMSRYTSIACLVFFLVSLTNVLGCNSS